MLLVIMIFGPWFPIPFEQRWVDDGHAPFLGLLAGYWSAHLYKMLKVVEWKTITLRTAFMFPAPEFTIFFVWNALIWGEKSSDAVPFGTM